MPRTHKKTHSAEQPIPRPAPGLELVRRALLGLSTALIVARAFVPAEDPGLLHPQSNPLGLVVTLLWLVGLAAWCAWRLWARQADWYGGFVELGLFVVVLTSFVATAFVASYKRPAWIMSWQWAGLLAAFFLVRQTARSASDRRGLLAALLATSVCLAAQSLYQHAAPASPAPFQGLDPADWPRLRCQILGTVGSATDSTFPAHVSWGCVYLATHEDGPAVAQRLPSRHNVYLETDEPALPLALRPKPSGPPTATFTSVGHFAGRLALVLPMLVGCALAAWRSGGPRWQTGALLACVLVVAAALGLTQVRGALLSCLLVSGAATVLAWRHGAAGLSPRWLLLLAFIGLTGLLVLAFFLSTGTGEVSRHLVEHWSGAWALVTDHFWAGVGPGNFARYYPQHMKPAAVDAEHPWGFLLDTLASGGALAALGLIVAVAVFFRRTLFLVRGPSSLAPEQAQGTSDTGQGTSWEFYEGGLVGLLLGFVLRALPLSGGEIVDEGVRAGVRALMWFALFALIHGVRWTSMTQVLACAAGVAALLIYLGGADGIAVPGLAEPLWVMAALALNGVPESPVPFGREWLGRLLPLPLIAAATLLFYFQTFTPVTEGIRLNQAALRMAQNYLDLRGGVAPEALPADARTIRNPGTFLAHIVDDHKHPDTPDLTKAVKADPLNARAWADRANWYGELYELFPKNTDYWKRSLGSARTSQRLDERGPAGYLAEARLHRLAAAAAADPEARRKALAEVPRPLGTLAGWYPHDARLRFRLAEALFEANDPVNGRIHAARALELDEQAPAAHRRLTDRQRDQLRQRLGPRP